VVVFDVGETLVDESRAWTEWAQWLGVPAVTMLGVLGAVIERRGDHLDAFRIIRPGFDLESERRARAAAGVPDGLRARDLYPDAMPCLETMARRGYRVGVVGNTNTDTERLIRERCGADFVASSASLGAAKPAPGFFAAVTRLAEAEPGEIVYVGDRVDNDVLPAIAAGMTAVHLRRGPWGYLHTAWPDAARAHLRIDSLAELADALDSMHAG
jgi:HAD superfamily hydrolase (TIGR01549 family)